MTQVPGAPVPPFNKDEIKQKKLIAALLGIFVGLGVHRFFMGDTKGGIIRLVLCCVPIGLVEGIIYLTKSEEEWYRLYIVEKKAWL